MKWLKYVFLVGCLIFAFLVFASLFDYLYFYEHYVAKAARLTGLNTYLLKAIGIVIFVPFALGIRWVFNPFSALTRRRGYITTCSAIAVYNLAFFFITRDQNFSVEDGASMRWYSIRDGHVFYYDRSGTDPVMGVLLKPVTTENAARLRRWERGETARVEPSENRFFSTMTGEPLLWYAKLQTGGYEFFDGPGFHPTTRAILTEVTPEVVQDWQEHHKPVAVASSDASHPTAVPPKEITALGNAPQRQTESRPSEPPPSIPLPRVPTRPIPLPALVAAKPKNQPAIQYDASEAHGWWPRLTDKDKLLAVVNRTANDPGRIFLLDGATAKYYRQNSLSEMSRAADRIVQTMGDDIHFIEFMSASSETVYVTIKTE